MTAEDADKLVAVYLPVRAVGELSPCTAITAAAVLVDALCSNAGQGNADVVVRAALFCDLLPAVERKLRGEA